MMNIKLLVWALLAGSFIPVVGIVNGRAGRVLGDPLQACLLVFVVTLLLALFVSFTAGRGVPDFTAVSRLQPIEYAGGLIVAFYVLSATVLAPQIGVANFIMMAVSGQIIFSLMIDHFGLFGAPVRPVNLMQVGGAMLLLTGLVITQLANSR